LGQQPALIIVPISPGQRNHGNFTQVIDELIGECVRNDEPAPKNRKKTECLIPFSQTIRKTSGSSLGSLERPKDLKDGEMERLSGDGYIFFQRRDHL
jgi:hypothetical protein